MPRCPTCQMVVAEDARACPYDGTALVAVTPTLGGEDDHPSDPAMLAQGFRAGPYTILRAIGRGGMGTVYEAEQSEIGRRAAIKVLGRALSQDPVEAERFVREARAVSAIRHPAIVDIYFLDRLSDGRLFLAMELLEGQSLAERLAGGRVTPEEAARIMEPVASALDAAHGLGIVHRDLKPANIFLCSGARPGIKLLDFGIAKFVQGGQTSATSTSVLVGTPQYMAPEQCAGDPLGPATDVYALGVVLYEMLSGRRPFAGRTAVELMYQHMQVPPAGEPLAALPPAVQKLTLAALAKAPEDRPASAGALARALTLAVGDRSPPAVALPVRRKVVVAVAVALSCAGALGVAVAVSKHGPEASPDAAAPRVPVRDAAPAPIMPDATLNGESTTGAKPTGGRPAGGKPVGGKPTGVKPTGGRPTGVRPTGVKPTGTKSGGKTIGAKTTGVKTTGDDTAGAVIEGLDPDKVKKKRK